MSKMSLRVRHGRDSRRDRKRKPPNQDNESTTHRRLQRRRKDRKKHITSRAEDMMHINLLREDNYWEERKVKLGAQRKEFLENVKKGVMSKIFLRRNLILKTNLLKLTNGKTISDKSDR
ncbi:uncharacterized protein LOC119649690 [Hermetia illucens]|uniref:uncharacterized protein LOC119649690 n=1 Tax=Hermetia illucens TaxID=343691 RepID=UPI0018CC3841|nr:uncharacterized protein LOC119649690 [Hermetia illucens]